MSGHSHWHSIKRIKEAEDKKRGKIFSKLSRMISVAAKSGGDVETNPKLRMAVEQAKGANMPKDKIERAIKRGTGELAGEKLEEVVIEAFGPGKTAIIIEGITDNKNRTLSEIKQILSQHSGKMANEGSVRWLFDKKGVITLEKEKQLEKFKEKESLELAAIEAGAEDIYWHQDKDVLDVYTKPEELEQVKKNLEKAGIKISSSSLDWVAKETIEASEEEKGACEKLFEALDENDAVQEIYSNLKT